MHLKDAEAIILREALAPEGMLKGLHAGEDPSAEALSALYEALRTVAAQTQTSTTISRQLACALHLLSFHAVGLIEARSGRWSQAVDTMMPLLYEEIDKIFGVVD